MQHYIVFCLRQDFHYPDGDSVCHTQRSKKSLTSTALNDQYGHNAFFVSKSTSTYFTMIQTKTVFANLNYYKSISFEIQSCRGQHCRFQNTIEQGSRILDVIAINELPRKSIYRKYATPRTLELHLYLVSCSKYVAMTTKVLCCDIHCLLHALVGGHGSKL